METERLILRQWCESDLEFFSEINSDPFVMRFFPSVFSKEKSKEQFDRYSGKIEENGWGFWALELKSNHQFIGMLGLNYKDENSSIPQTPFVEIGWRLSKSHWGKGYAPEAATASLKYAFEELKLQKVYAFTSLLNNPSIRVMEKIGMRNMGRDFDHPDIPSDSHLKKHCLYMITAKEWFENQL